MEYGGKDVIEGFLNDEKMSIVRDGLMIIIPKSELKVG